MVKTVAAVSLAGEGTVPCDRNGLGSPGAEHKDQHYLEEAGKGSRSR